MSLDPRPLYWIGLKPAESEYARIVTQDTQNKIDECNAHRWLQPSEMHVTLALPGRPGEVDVDWMVEKLKFLCAYVAPFTIALGRLNCFPHVIFREVFSPDQSVFHLHKAIANEIPASLEPQYQHENFLPHMSLCYLRHTDDALAARISGMRESEEVSTTISSIVLVEASDVADIGERPLASIKLAG